MPPIHIIRNAFVTHDWLRAYLDRNLEEARSSFLSVGSPKPQRAGGQALRSKQYLDLQSQQAALQQPLVAWALSLESGDRLLLTPGSC